ncbi:MAG TPA: cytochrome P450 [Polyangiaceae bacterium]|jgi:cytochrome P450
MGADGASGAAAWKIGLTGAPAPPLSRGLPWVGHLGDLVKDAFPLLLEKHRELGPCFRIRAMGQEWTCLVGADANALITHTGYDLLVTGESYQGFNDAFRSRSFLIGLDGPAHAHLRRIERRAFSREALARKLPEAVALTDRTIGGWRDGATVDVVAELKALVVAHLGVTLTGRDASALLADVQILLNHIVAVTQLKIWPRFLLRLPRFTGARARVYADIQRLIDARRRSPSPAGEEDLIDDMLAAKTLEGAPLPDEAIIAATMGAYMAGLDTAAIIASFILYAVLKHPAVHRRVLEEIDQAFADGPPTWERMTKMTAFRGACMEAMRMYPVVGLLPRDAAQDFEFAGYQVRKGDRLFLGITATHFDRRFYREPMLFDIDRYAPPREEHKPPGAFAPFGLGAHKCLGGNMGELQSMIVVATLLHRLELRLDPVDYEVKVEAKPLRRPDAKFRIKVLGRRQRATVAKTVLRWEASPGATG